MKKTRLEMRMKKMTRLEMKKSCWSLRVSRGMKRRMGGVDQSCS